MYLKEAQDRVRQEELEKKANEKIKKVEEVIDPNAWSNE